MCILIGSTLPCFLAMSTIKQTQAQAVYVGGGGGGGCLGYHLYVVSGALGCTGVD